MNIVVAILAVLFGLIHGAAAVTQFKSADFASRGSAVIMVCGGIAVICAAVAHMVGANPIQVDALSLAVGCMLICFAAFLNGKRAKKLNPRHHVIRAAIAAMLVMSFVLW